MQFDLQNKTRIVFGAGEIPRLRELVSGYRSVLMLYGGGSIKSNGVYEQVVSALDGCSVVEVGGVEPNPEYETILMARVAAYEAQVDFVLGVGGGSVIDAS